MTPQLIGTRNSSETRKVERYFKERGMEYQFIDLNERGLAPKELDRIAETEGEYDNLIDRESKQFKKRKMQYMAYEAREELLEDPLLIRQPIVRCDGGIALQPDRGRLDALFG